MFPGKVVACFTTSQDYARNCGTAKAFAYSKYLWNKINGLEDYLVDAADFSDPFMLFDDEETEDLLFIYLQTQGWYVIPNSRKGRHNEL